VLLEERHQWQAAAAAASRSNSYQVPLASTVQQSMGWPTVSQQAGATPTNSIGTRNSKQQAAAGGSKHEG